MLLILGKSLSLPGTQFPALSDLYTITFFSEVLLVLLVYILYIVGIPSCSSLRNELKGYLIHIQPVAEAELLSQVTIRCLSEGSSPGGQWALRRSRTAALSQRSHPLCDSLWERLAVYPFTHCFLFPLCSREGFIWPLLHWWRFIQALRKNAQKA